jgi:hypothetical protein
VGLAAGEGWLGSVLPSPDVAGADLLFCSVDGHYGGDAGVDPLRLADLADFPAAVGFLGCGRHDVRGEGLAG